MKKTLAIVLAAVMVLSCNMTAFAEITVDGQSKETGTVSVDTAGFVKVDAEGDNLTVKGDVNGEGDQKGSIDPVQATNGTVTVVGNVNDSSGAHAVLAWTGATVTAGSVTDSNNGDAVHAFSGATVTAGSVTESGDGEAVHAENAGTEVKVSGDVAESGAGNAIVANDGADVAVNSIREQDEGDAISAWGATVTVNGNVEEYGKGAAVSAVNSSKVVVVGNILENGEGADDDLAIGALASTVLVVGNVESLSGGNAITAYNEAEVIVEGTVKGNIDNQGGMVFVGKLDGETNNAGKGVFYLIGMADDAVRLKDFKYTGVADPKTGASGKTYNSVGAEDIAGSRITLTPKGKKKIDISKLVLPAGVTSSEKDGVLILEFDATFKGGLQEMLITLSDIIDPTPKKSSSGSTYTLYTGTWNKPVTNGKWTQNADGIWSYATTAKFANTWGCIADSNTANSPSWYYFDRNGNMLTGWQKLYWNGAYKWYYFSQTKDSNEGKCLVDCITPDGYKVGPDGAWIED